MEEHFQALVMLPVAWEEKGGEIILSVTEKSKPYSEVPDLH